MKNEIKNVIKAFNCFEEKSDEAKNLKLAKRMSRFLIAGEDHRFWHHPGVDLIAIGRAIWKTLFTGVREGGSTIAMQLIRVITGHYEVTWQRKVREIILAVWITWKYGREKLPTMYLTIAYYGSGMNNLNQALDKLGIDPVEICDFDAAELVARLKYPEPRNLTDERREKIRRRTIYLIKREEKLRVIKKLSSRGNCGEVQNSVSVGKF